MKTEYKFGTGNYSPAIRSDVNQPIIKKQFSVKNELTPALPPVEPVGVLVAPHLDRVVLREGQLLVASVRIGGHGGGVVVEQRHEEPGPLLRVRGITRVGLGAVGAAPRALHPLHLLPTLRHALARLARDRCKVNGLIAFGITNKRTRFILIYSK